MDELIIGDQTYLSSKRAAKITGYAKDYIGQLCREGRVTAKLVGRSWYVLESSIRDHRFGDASVAVTAPTVKAPSPSAVPASEPVSRTWDAPRYEAVTHDTLPPINRLDRDIKASITTSEYQLPAPDTVPQDMNAAWQAWFNRVGDIKGDVSSQIHETESSTAESVEPLHSVETESVPESEESTHTPIEDPEVHIPIHAIYQPELRVPESREVAPPQQMSENRPTPEIPRHGERVPSEERAYGVHRTVIRLVYFICFFTSIFLITVAIIGSGYVDSYVISSVQAPNITGISIYNSK